jgi:hypothetical protein
MRTKALVCLAAFAAGAVTVMAQANVYSLNVVGYVNYTQPAGKNAIITNPLKSGGNDVSEIFTAGPSYPNVTVYKRNSSGTGYDQSMFDPDLNGWSSPLVVNPGDGVWLATPPGIPFTNTFVGEVILNSTNPLPAGFTIKGPVLPQAGLVQTDLKIPGAPNDTIYEWNGNNGYNQYIYDADIGFWNPEPTIPVCGAFWYYNAGATKDWIRNFTP